MILEGGKQGRRAAIVAAAFEEFCEGGFERTRMESIARRAGIGKSTIYEYFPSKTDLLTAVGEWILDSCGQDLAVILEGEGKFRDIVYRYLQYMHSLIQKAGAGLLAMQGNAPTFQMIQECGERFRDFLMEGVARAAGRARQRGEIAAEIQPKAAAWLIVSMSSPILSLETSEWEATIQSTLDVLFRGLEPR